MKKFEVVIIFINIIIFGISSVVGNIISNTYYGGNQIVEYGVCFGTLLVGLLVELSIHFALKKRKNLPNSDKSQDVKKSNIPNKMRVIILSLVAVGIALIVLATLGCYSIIPLGTLGIVLLVIFALLLACICFAILFVSAK